MKKAIIFIFQLGFLIATAFGNENEKIFKSKIDNVTVFLSGAQVERTSNVNLKKGITKVVLENVSPNLDANSLQATGRGDFIILSVTKDIKYPEPEISQEVLTKNQKAIKQLQDSIKWLDFDLEDLKYRMGFLNTEKDLLIKNKIITGEAKGDSLELFQNAMLYMRKQLFDINKTLREYRKEEIEMSETRVGMNTRLTKLKNYELNAGNKENAGPTHRVVVTVQASKDVYGKVNVSYIVAGAGWKPSYDIRAHNTRSPVELTYKAEVYQNSGVDWDGVSMTLSSNSAYRTTTKPELPTWYLNYYTHNAGNRGLMNGGGYMMDSLEKNFKDDYRQVAIESSKKMEELEEAQNSAMYAQMVTGKVNVEFELELKYSIKSGAGGQLMAIQQKDLKSDYYHYLVPKMDKEAFLLARVDGWEELNLLPAEASIFFEGTYIGKSIINPEVIQDTLEIALGRDSRVICKRELLKDKEKEKFIGNNKLVSYNYEIEIKNNRDNTIKNLIVEDQIPVTHIEEIKIDLLKKDGARLNERNGRLTWNFSLAARQKKKYQFGYSIKHDKNKLLSAN